MSNSTTFQPKPVRATIGQPIIGRPTIGRPSINRPGAQTRTRSQVTVRAKLVSYPQTRSHARAHRAEVVLFRVLMFCFVFLTAYGISSISGQVAVEKSRKEEAHARARTENAMQTENNLKAHLDDLTRPDKIEAWALEHHFVGGPNDAAPKPSNGLLAIRD